MPKQRHDERELKSGRFSKSPPCDFCGKPVGTEYFTDDEAVIQGTDGPGFFLCGRARCVNKREALDAEARRAAYTAMVATTMPWRLRV